ncbi:MAG: hypothetical protein AAF366_16145 [Pseudomonadota bacterium]
MAKGIHHVDRPITAAEELPETARTAMDMLVEQLRDTQARIGDVTDRISEMQGADAVARRLGDTARHGHDLIERVCCHPPDVGAFRSARE